MSEPTGEDSLGRRIEAAKLRRAFHAATMPQPTLVPSLRGSGPINSPAPWSAAARRLGEAWAWLLAAARRNRDAQRGRRLRVMESVGLGEKRLLAIVRAGDEEFLVGSAPAGLSLLTRLRSETAAVSTDSAEAAPRSSAAHTSASACAEEAR